jgi:endonuclease G
VGVAILKFLVASATLVWCATAALAAPPACPQHFLDGDPPLLVNEKLAPRTREICYEGFAVLHSGITRTPLWSAEHLTRARIEAAHGIDRHNAFHAEPRLPRGDRAELSDYARSGFDRGHMAPSGDMPDRRAQRQSFSLANMVPQNPNNNRNLWEGIESAVRGLAQRDGALYVVTGPIFAGANLKSLRGRVLVPTGLFKAIYDVQRHQAGAYVVPNAPGDRWQAVSIARLQETTGIDVFPDLPAQVKDAVMALPEPTRHSRQRPRARREMSEGSGATAPRSGNDAAEPQETR